MDKVKEDGVLTPGLLCKMQKVLFGKEKWYKELKNKEREMQKMLDAGYSLTKEEIKHRINM